MPNPGQMDTHIREKKAAMSKIEVKPAPRPVTVDDAPLGILAGAGASVLSTNTIYFLGTMGDEEAYYFEPPEEQRGDFTGYPLVILYNTKTLRQRFPELGDEMNACFALLKALAEARGELPDGDDDEDEDEELEDEE